MPPIRADLSFDAVRVWFGDALHIHLRRSEYLGFQAWKFPGNYKIEFTLRGGTMLVEYTDETRWREVLAALAALPLSGG